MIIAVTNVYYNNRMFKPGQPLPCYDMKMVQAWLKAGTAKDTEAKVQAKPAPAISVKAEPKAEVNTEAKVEEKKEVKTVKVKTRTKK